MARAPKRIFGPVHRGYGNIPSDTLDIAMGRNALRKCNCCGNTLIKTHAYSHNAKLRNYSHTCRSCCNFIWLFSIEWAKDYENKPKQVRVSKYQKLKIQRELQLAKEKECLRLKIAQQDLARNQWLTSIPKLTVWRHV